MADIDTALVLRLEASLNSFERQMKKAQAVARGTTTGIEKDFTRMGANIAVSASRGAAGIERIAAMSGRGRFVLQNTANQLGDIAVQMAAGTSASRVMAQQLPQLFGGFGALGGALGIAMPLLGTLAAIGIPVGAALLAMGRGSEEAAFQLEKINGLSLDQARSAIEGLADLQRKYTEAVAMAAETRDATTARNVAAIGREYEAQRALLDLKRLETEADLARVQALIAAKREELSAMMDRARQTAEASILVTPGDPDGMRRYNEAVAAAMLEVIDANQELIRGIRQAEAEQTLLQLATEALGQALDSAAVAADGIAAAPMSGNIDAATASAQALADALGVALGTAQRLMALGGATSGERRAQFKALQAEGQMAAPGATIGEVQSMFLPGGVAYSAPPSTGGGGGGGGAAEVDRMAAAFQSLRGQLDPAWASLEKLGEAQSTLNWALGQGLITLPEFEALMAKANTRFQQGAQDVGNYAQELGNALGGFLTDFYQELRNGEGAWGAFKSAALNAMDAIAQEALRMAAMGIVQAIFGGGMASPAPAGGVLGAIFGAPSFAGGGYTGSGARAGGIDGKGGFPAILHPRETVVDHARGQAAPVQINISGDIPRDAVRQRQGRVDIDLGRMVAAAIGGGAADGALRGRFGLAPRGSGA